MCLPQRSTQLQRERYQRETKASLTIQTWFRTLTATPDRKARREQSLWDPIPVGVEEAEELPPDTVSDLSSDAFTEAEEEDLQERVAKLLSGVDFKANVWGAPGSPGISTYRTLTGSELSSPVKVWEHSPAVPAP